MAEDRLSGPAVDEQAAAPRSIALAALALVAVLGHLTLFPNVADLDAFYHLGHAAAYLERSIFDTSLPWATQSVIGDRGADIWWGFHMLLAPFAALGVVEWSIRAAAFALTLLLAGTVLAVLRRHGVPGGGWWAALFLVAVPNVFFRYLMARPHMVSLPLGLLLLSVLARGRWWQAGLISAAITWVHLGMFWLAPGLLGAYGLVRVGERLTAPRPGSAPDGDSVPLAVALAVVPLGTLLGWLLRPHPIEAASLATVQIIRLLAEKATEEPLLFARELLPLPLGNLAYTSAFLLFCWICAVVLTAVSAARERMGDMRWEDRRLLLASLLVSIVFFVLTVVSARRAQVEWSAFAFLVLPLTWTYLVGLDGKRSWRALFAVLCAANVAWGAGRHLVNVERVSFEADTMEEVAGFLEGASEPGDLVFHAHWDNFGPLFARNRTNVYLGGMDPIFQFSHSPQLYWEYFYISADVNVEWTCDAFPCADGVATDTYDVLRDHFGARWVVVEPRRNPRLSLYLLNDRRYALRLETRSEAVFEVLEPSAGDGSGHEEPSAVGEGERENPASGFPEGGADA
jgi:hypothetical protein